MTRRLGLGRSAQLLVLVPIWFACVAQAEELAAPPLAKETSNVEAPAQDCKGIADQLTTAFPGSVSRIYERPDVPTADGKPRVDARWIVDLPGDHTIRVLCKSKSIGLSLASAEGSSKAAGERLKIADQAAGIFSGVKVENGASRCLRAVKRVQKKAGKVGRAHARMINAIPHFEGEIKLGSLTVECRYDYSNKHEMIIDYTLLFE